MVPGIVEKILNQRIGKSKETFSLLRKTANKTFSWLTLK